MKPIFLIGYMASGKTTFGKALASRLSIPFYDLDELIEAETGKSINDIFQEKGEDFFRNLETEKIKSFSDKNDIIVACGGGTPCICNNIQIMNAVGLTVWLDAPIEVIERRLIEERASRPLVANLSETELRNFIILHLNLRVKFYRQAHIRFDSSQLESPIEISSSVNTFLNLLQNK